MFTGHFLVRILCCVTLLAMFLPSWGQGVSPGSGKLPASRESVIAGDIAAAGILRLQAERIAKLRIQAGLGLDASVAMRRIEQAVKQTENQLGSLAGYGRKPGTQRAYERSLAAWQELRAATLAPYSMAGAERLGQLAETLTIHAGKLAMLIESEGETPVSRLLDLSSRLNMLAQRLARLYMLVKSGVHSHGVLVDLEQTRQEFMGALQELDVAPGGTQTSRDALRLVRNQWIFFDAAVRQVQVKGADGKAAQHVASSSERIAESLDLVMAQYVRDMSGGFLPVR